MNVVRGQPIKLSGNSSNIDQSVWSPIFNNFDDTRRTSIELRGPDLLRSVAIWYDEADNVVEFEAPSYLIDKSARQIVFEWDNHDDRPSHVIRPSRSEAGLNLGLNDPTAQNALYFGSGLTYSSEEAAGRLSELRKQKLESESVKIVSSIFKNVRGISAERDADSYQLFADVRGVPQLIPLHFVSAGISKAAAILLGIESKDTKTAFIDEIENGLHFSMLPAFWKALERMCRGRGVQLFVTTHSQECLQALVSASGVRLNEVAFYRTDLNRAGASTVERVSSKDVAAALEYGTEVR